MGTYKWSIPTNNIITGSTLIKETDNKIQDTLDDLVDFVNGEGSHNGQGLTFDLVDRNTSDSIVGIKTFANGLVGNLTGNVTGNVTGNLTGNADTATHAATSTTLDGMTASVSEINKLDGITATTTELNYVDGVTSNIQTQLNIKIENDDYATPTTGGTMKARLNGNTLYLTNNGSDA